MTTNDLGHATAPVALDTCILIRNTARRMLAGVQEACSSWILLLQETVRECNVPYAAVAGKRIKRRLEREALARWGRNWSDPQVRWLRTEGRRLTSREARGFKRWVYAEVLRNDSAYTLGPKKTEADVERAEQIAVEALEGDPGEQWGKGDPLVIAQAARAGAELVGTDNMRRVHQAKLDTLIAEWKAEGFCPNARIPFVRTADEAVAARLHDEREHVFDRRCTRIAYSVCRPGSVAGRFPEQALNVLDGFMIHLEADGMPGTAAAIEREKERWFKREARWFDALEAERLDLPRTRAGEDRRREYEQGNEPGSQVVRD